MENQDNLKDGWYDIFDYHTQSHPNHFIARLCIIHGRIAIIVDDEDSSRARSLQLNFTMYNKIGSLWKRFVELYTNPTYPDALIKEVKND